MEDLQSQLEVWENSNKFGNITLKDLDGSQLASYIKNIQQLERQLLQEFERELAKINPREVTQQSLDLINNYNKSLTEMDVLHQNATAAYLELSSQEKILFMGNLLPTSVDAALYDNFLAKSNKAFVGTPEDRAKSLLAFRSDVLKLITTPEGYYNLKKLDENLSERQTNRQQCGEINIVLKAGAISQTYFATRSSFDGAARENTFITPKSIVDLKGTIPNYIKQLDPELAKLQSNDFEKPVMINTGLAVTLHFPFPNNINKPIIKIGQNNLNGEVSFIYSPRFVSLHHEFNHMVRMLEGKTLDWGKAPENFNYVYKNIEEYAAIQAENALRANLGLSPRLTHSGITYDIPKPPENESEIQAYSEKQAKSLEEFQNRAIDMYFRALLEVGIIPENEFNLKLHEKGPAIIKLELINQYLPHLVQQEMTDNNNELSLPWISTPSNPRFVEIKDQEKIEKHLLYPLVKANLLDPQLLTDNLLNEQEIKNLNNLEIQKAILDRDLDIGIARQLTDQQVSRISKSNSNNYAEILSQVKSEVESSKKTTEKTTEEVSVVVETQSQSTQQLPKFGTNNSS